MGNNVSIGKEIKIRDVKKIWTEIKSAEIPLVINMKKVEITDGAGFQLLIFLISLGEDFPDKYQIKGLSEKLINLLVSYGFNKNKREVKK